MSKKTKAPVKKNIDRFQKTPQLLVLHNDKDSLYILDGNQDVNFFSLNGPVICQAFNYIISKKPIPWIVENIHSYYKDVSVTRIQRDVQSLVSQLVKNKLIERVS